MCVGCDDKSKIIDRLIAEGLYQRKALFYFLCKRQIPIQQVGKNQDWLCTASKRISDELIHQALSTIDEGEYEEMLLQY